MKYLKLFENWLLEAEGEADGAKILETLKKTTIGAFKKASDKLIKSIYFNTMGSKLSDNILLIIFFL